MTSAAENEHPQAAARHAKKRAARLKGKAGKKSTPKSRNRERLAEPSPTIDLTPAQLREVLETRRQTLETDNQAAEARPSQLTPKQLKRLAVSEAKKAALGGADVESRSTEQPAKKRKLTPPKPKPDKTMALANKLARERRLAAKRNRPSN